jgi:hypothetical protein
MPCRVMAMIWPLAVIMSTSAAMCLHHVSTYLLSALHASRHVRSVSSLCYGRAFLEFSTTCPPCSFMHCVTCLWKWIKDRREVYMRGSHTADDFGLNSSRWLLGLARLPVGGQPLLEHT